MKDSEREALLVDTKQVKSKERVSAHGEVFTAPREVNAMLDLVKGETERIESRFLEPACGDGNFLIEILRRKMAIVDERYFKSMIDWEYNAAIAVSSIYGVELLEDNAKDCRDRLFDYFCEEYNKHSGKHRKNKNDFLKSIQYLLQKNIVCGDALTYRTAKDEPIIFAEWTPIGEGKVGRCDFQFDFMVEQSYQYTLFDAEGEVQKFDSPVKSFLPKHYTKLYEYEE